MGGVSKGEIRDGRDANGNKKADNGYQKARQSPVSRTSGFNSVIIERIDFDKYDYLKSRTQIWNGPLVPVTALRLSR